MLPIYIHIFKRFTSGCACVCVRVPQIRFSFLNNLWFGHIFIIIHLKLIILYYFLYICHLVIAILMITLDLNYVLLCIHEYKQNYIFFFCIFVLRQKAEQFTFQRCFGALFHIVSSNSGRWMSHKRPINVFQKQHVYYNHPCEVNSVIANDISCSITFCCHESFAVTETWRTERPQSSPNAELK